MKIAAVDLQGFLIDGRFYPKELSIKINEQSLHLLIKPPIEYHFLSEADRKQVRYLEQSFHGLQYSSGYVEYHLVQEILKKCLYDVDIIYIKGYQKEQFLQSIVDIDPTKIINIEKLENSVSLPKFEKGVPFCLYHIKSSKYYKCSLRNCEKLSYWLHTNKNDESTQHLM